MSAAFMNFIFHILWKLLLGQTAVRAENTAFCNYSSIYEDNKTVLSRIDKISCVILQTKSFQTKLAETNFNVFQNSVSMPCLEFMISSLIEFGYEQVNWVTNVMPDLQR